MEPGLPPKFAMLTPPASPSKGKSVVGQGFSRLSSQLFRGPLAEPTVIHRNTHQCRPSLEHLGLFPGRSSPPSPLTPTTAESSKLFDGFTPKSKSPNESTPKSSADSKFRLSLPLAIRSKHNTSNNKDDNNNITVNHTVASPTKSHRLHIHSGNACSSRLHGSGHHHGSPNARSSPDSNLATIQEILTEAKPLAGILTVERAAAAKIYLEIFYNTRLGPKLNPREMRLQQLKADLYVKSNLATVSGLLLDEEQEETRRRFFLHETNHLRESRVMKARSLRDLSAPKGTRSGRIVDDYDIVKVLGKGSFGVVRLVKEKHQAKTEDYSAPAHRLLNGDRRQVYAMKVIRKSAMLRNCQEGHLRAERDFLVASEGSRW
jgi:protein-serine/threonine kinase